MYGYYHDMIINFLFTGIPVIGITLLQDEYADTPLLVACGRNNINVASFLIRKGANIKIKNKVI
jgi:ankyrin repeat protein